MCGVWAAVVDSDLARAERTENAAAAVTMMMGWGVRGAAERKVCMW